MFGLSTPCAYAACRACGSLSQVGEPDDAASLYPPAYYSFGRPDISRRSVIRALVAGAVLRGPRLLRRHPVTRLGVPDVLSRLASSGVKRDSTIADVGSGDGGLLQWLVRCGFSDVTGIDPFISESGMRGQVRLHKGLIRDVGRTFDVVMFHHSLEHMADPVAALAEARDCTVPGGLVFVRVPVVAFAWRRYGVDWVGLDAPRHLHIPTVEGIARLARRVGLEVEDVFFDSYDLQFWGSELYRRGLPLKTGPAGFPASKRRRWRRTSRRLNRAADGDSAGFLLRVPGGP